QAKIDQGKDNVSNVTGATHTPMIEHHARCEAETLQREFAACMREFGTGDMATFGQVRLAELERSEHKQVCTLVEPLLTQADLIHDAFTECQLGHYQC